MIDLEIVLDPLRLNYLRQPLDRNNVDTGFVSPLRTLYCSRRLRAKSWKVALSNYLPARNAAVSPRRGINKVGWVGPKLDLTRAVFNAFSV